MFTFQRGENSLMVAVINMLEASNVAEYMPQLTSLMTVCEEKWVCIIITTVWPGPAQSQPNYLCVWVCTAIERWKITSLNDSKSYDFALLFRCHICILNIIFYAANMTHKQHLKWQKEYKMCHLQKCNVQKCQITKLLLSQYIMIKKTKNIHVV